MSYSLNGHTVSISTADLFINEISEELMEEVCKSHVFTEVFNGLSFDFQGSNQLGCRVPKIMHSNGMDYIKNLKLSLHIDSAVDPNAPVEQVPVRVPEPVSYEVDNSYWTTNTSSYKINTDIVTTTGNWKVNLDSGSYTTPYVFVKPQIAPVSFMYGSAYKLNIRSCQFMHYSYGDSSYVNSYAYFGNSYGGSFSTRDWVVDAYLITENGRQIDLNLTLVHLSGEVEALI